MTSIYLIRHAQAAGNAGNRFQGRLDQPLTEEGRKQTILLGERFRGIPLSAVYTSPLSRASETAQAVARLHRLTPIPVEDLVEMDLGGFEDRSFPDLKEAHPEALHNFFDAPHLFEGVDGGESYAAVCSRMRVALDDLAAHHSDETIAVVTHGCALRSLFCSLLDYPLDRMPEIPWCPNTGVSHVVYLNSRPLLVSVADLSHLEESS